MYNLHSLTITDGGKIQGLSESQEMENTWTQFDMTDANGYPNNQNTNNPQDEVINISSMLEIEIL